MTTLVILMMMTTMVISLSSVNGQQPPPPYPPGECFANFTGVCSNTTAAADVARCCAFWSDLMNNENDHPCICLIFGVAMFSYEDSLGYLLDCQVNVTGFNFCPELRGSPKLSPPPPPGKIPPSPPPIYNTTRKPPPIYNTARKPPPIYNTARKPPPQPSIASDFRGTPSTPPSNSSVVAGISVGAILFVLLLFAILFFLGRKLWPEDELLTEDQRMKTFKTFKYEELVRATNGFSEENIIGKGGYACVYRGLLRDRREVAVKKLHSVGEEGKSELQIEIDALRGLYPHKHVVSLIGHCITVERSILVYEFVPNGSLNSRLHGKSLMDWSTRMRIAVGSARGIAFLHDYCCPGIIHRDIKSDNILLDENFEAKIADFGLAKWKPEDKTHISTLVKGTRGYLAPEYAATGQVTQMADIYSFGAVIIELITGQIPGAKGGRFMNELFIDWVIPFLIRSIQDQDYDAIADPRLNGEYDHNEMARMVACGASCIQYAAELRPKMSLIIPILEGEVPVNVLNLDCISYNSSESHDSIQQRARNSTYTGRRRNSTEASTCSDQYSGTTTTGLSIEIHSEEESLFSTFGNQSKDKNGLGNRS